MPRRTWDHQGRYRPKGPDDKKKMRLNVDREGMALLTNRRAWFDLQVATIEDIYLRDDRDLTEAILEHTKDWGLAEAQTIFQFAPLVRAFALQDAPEYAIHLVGLEGMDPDVAYTHAIPMARLSLGLLATTKYLQVGGLPMAKAS